MLNDLVTVRGRRRLQYTKLDMGLFLSAVMTGHPQRLRAQRNHSKGEKMALTLRPTGTSTASVDLLDFTVYESGNPVGRIFESPEFGTQEDPYWFWAITVYVDPQTEIVTSGKVQTFNEAKERFRDCWHKIASGGRGEGPSLDGD